MIYLKGLLGGILGVVVLAVLHVLVGSFRPTGSQVVGWDPISFFHRPLFWVLVLLCFGSGALVAVKLASR
jgi:hypothetical protein